MVPRAQHGVLPLKDPQVVGLILLRDLLLLLDIHDGRRVGGGRGLAEDTAAEVEGQDREECVAGLASQGLGEATDGAPDEEEKAQDRAADAGLGDEVEALEAVGQPAHAEGGGLRDEVVLGGGSRDWAWARWGIKQLGGVSRAAWLKTPSDPQAGGHKSWGQGHKGSRRPPYRLSKSRGALPHSKGQQVVSPPYLGHVWQHQEGVQAQEEGDVEALAFLHPHGPVHVTLGPEMAACQYFTQALVTIQQVEEPYGERSDPAGLFP